MAPRWDDDESEEFSETDISIEEEVPRRRRFRRTSVSRHRRAPETMLLQPNVVSVRRSHSTGVSHRKRQQSPASPTVVIDVNNSNRTRNISKDRRNNRVIFDEVDDEIDDIEISRSHRRPRASSQVPSRAPSPRERERDWELLMEQRLLEKSDQRQDLELLKQQQDIERLERQLARRREKEKLEAKHEARQESRQETRQETRLIVQEDDHWDDEISEKLRKLERLERQRRAEEERKLASYREKVKKLDEIERKAAEEQEAKRLARERHLKELEEKEASRAEAKRLAREQHLKELEEKEAARAEKARIEKELRDEEARKTLAEEERKKELARMRAEAIKEYKQAEEAKKLKEIEEKEKRDKEYRERLKRDFGYSEEQIEAFLKRKDKETSRERSKERSKSPPHHHHHDQTTYIKVHRKYLLPETLISYHLPWDWDERDRNYIIIKTYVSEELQEELFAHSRRLREGKLVTETSNTLTEFKLNDKKRDKMYLVRKKGPGKSAFIVTS